MKAKHILLLLAQIATGIFLVGKDLSGESGYRMTLACMISRGTRLYTDVFDDHGPLMVHVIGWMYRLTGSCSMYLPQYVLFVLFCAALWLIVIYGKSVRTAIVLLATYALLWLSYGTLAVVSENWITAIVLIVFVLLHNHERMPRILFWILFIVVQLSLILENPVNIPCAFILLTYFIFKRKYSTHTLLLATIVPAFLFFVTTVSFPAYWKSVYLFNLNLVKPIQTIQAEYFLGLIKAIQALFAGGAFWKDTIKFRAIFETSLLVTWIAVFISVIRKKYRGIKLFVHILIPLSLFIRADSFHLVPFIFFLLAEITYELPMNKFTLAVFGYFLLLGARLSYYPSQVNIMNLYRGRAAYFTSVVRAQTKEDTGYCFFRRNPTCILYRGGCPVLLK